MTETHDISVSDFVRAFHVGARTGIVHLLNGDAHGVIYLAEGRIIDATLARGAERTVVATRDEAVVRMLPWKAATLRFQADSAVCRRPVRVEHDDDWMLRESLRRRGLASPVDTPAPPGLDTPVRVALHAAAARHGVLLSGAQWSVLSHIARGSTVRGACAATRLDHTQALDVAAELIAQGLVEIVEAPGIQVETPGVVAPAQEAIPQPPSGRLGTRLDPDPTVAPPWSRALVAGAMALRLDDFASGGARHEPANVAVAERAVEVTPGRAAEPPIKRNVLRALIGRIRGL